MPYTPQAFTNAPTAFMRANGLLQKRPIYYVTFGLVTGPLYPPNSQVLPDEYATGPIKNATKTRKRIMSIPSGYSSEFDPIAYTSTLGEINFDLNNKDGEGTRLVTNYILKNRECTVYRGFDFIDEADFVVIYKGQISNVKRSSDGTFYTFTVSDRRKQLISTILQGHTSLAQDFVYNDTHHDTDISVQFNTGFATKTNMLDGLGARNYLRMGDNLWSYTGQSTTAIIVDGGAEWRYAGDGYAQSAQPTWQAGTYYATGAQVFNQGSNFVNIGAPGGTARQMHPPEWPGPTTDYSPNLIWLCPTPYLNNTDWLQWRPNIVVTAGNQCYNNGRRYVCVVGGTTAGSGGPAGTGTTSFHTFSGLALVQPDGNGNGVGQSYKIGDSVDNFVLYSGHPIDLILQILMSTGGCPGPNWSGTGTNYDVLPLGQGIGIPYDQIDINHIEAQKALMGAMTFHGYFSDEVQALKFIEDHILQQAHVFFFLNRLGLIDCTAVFDTIDITGAITLNQDNVIGQPEFDANLPTGNQFYNDIWINFDYRPVTDYFATVIRDDQSSDSMEAYREISSISIDAKLINSSYGGVTLAERCTKIFRTRFAYPPPIFTCMTFDAIHLLDPGSIVILDHPNAPNYLTGKDGGPIVCQSLNVAPDFPTGQVKVTLLAIGWYGYAAPP